MPAATASRRIACSCVEICINWSLPRSPGRSVGPILIALARKVARSAGWGGALGSGRGEGFLVRGKLSHRLRDLVRVRHEELLVRSVERHGRDVWRRDPDHRAVEVTEGVLRDDGRDLGA